MEINNKLKSKINNSVVRIIAEDIDINWNIPYQMKEPSKGQGSGFFIDNKGYILTCAHVINGSKNLYIEIPFIGPEKYECDIIGICPTFDIGLIKVKNYKNKDFLTLGDSNKLKVGAEVQVVGYPVSGKTSNNSNNLKYTKGIISGQQQGFIQTDSAINPGNSGGPLFSNNKVIGINSRKLVGSSLENIGYAIPINNYKVIEDDFNQNIVYRPNLLFEFNNTDKDMVKILTNGKTSSGIMVSKVYDESILSNSNIKNGTIITEINNHKIDNFGLTDYKWIGTQVKIDILLHQLKNNSMISIKYYNNEKLETYKCKLTPFIPQIRRMYYVFEKEIPYLIIGSMIFMNLCENHQSNNNINLFCKVFYNKENLAKEKVIVSYIFPNTKVDILKNIKTYDIIAKVNDISVSNISEFKKALKKPLKIKNKEYIKLETDDFKSVIISVSDIIKENKKFSNIYKYPVENLK